MGTAWSKSGHIERDSNDRRAAGALARFYAGGTTTPLTVYQDAAETTPHEAAVAADGNGRWPLVIIPFTASYDVKVTTAAGTQLYYHRELPNPDPIEASEDSVDDTQLMQTGDFTFSPVNETRTGFVRANGRTIGSATSGASERANADCEDLFTFLWNKIADAQCAVVTGRGASAAADWAANKAITLPDCRGGHPIGLDTMGNSAGSFFTGVSFVNGNATTACSLAGLNTHTLVAGELPTITPAGTLNVTGTISFPSASRSVSVSTPTGTVGITDPGHVHGQVGAIDNNGHAPDGSNDYLTSTAAGPNTVSNTTGITASFTGNALTASFNQNTLTATWTVGTKTFTGSSFGSDDAHNNVSRSILGSWYIKL